MSGRTIDPSLREAHHVAHALHRNFAGDADAFEEAVRMFFRELAIERLRSATDNGPSTPCGSVRAHQCSDLALGTDRQRRHAKWRAFEDMEKLFGYDDAVAR